MRFLSSTALLIAVGACSQTIAPPVLPVIGEIPVDQIPGISRPSLFDSDWSTRPDRVWIGADFWANRLQDWRLRDGRAECVSTRLPFRSLHLLPSQISNDDGEVVVRVRTGALPAEDGEVPDGALSGVLLGAGAADLDYRAAALVQSAPGPGGGWLAGLRADGTLVLRDFENAPARSQWTAELPEAARGHGDYVLEVRVLDFEPAAASAAASGSEGQAASLTTGGNADTQIEVSVFPGSLLDTALQQFDGSLPDDFLLSEDSVPLVRVVSDPVDAASVAGNLALMAHRNGYWFSNLHAHGSRLDQDDDQRFGPVLAAQHTLSRGTLKMTAQLPPISSDDSQELLLQTWVDGNWSDLARAGISRPSYTATFRVSDWPADQDVDYRLVYESGDEREVYKGTVRMDPVDRDSVVLAGFTGNHNVRHGFGRANFPWSVEGLWFPHADLVQQVEKHAPDVLFFSGDQIYEGASPTFADRGQAELDYLYKWYLWCWAFGDLARDTVCITIPDDHDVYQPNLWGQSGRPAERDHDGGYTMPPEFVHMVERTQTSHLPDPWYSGELEQGLTAYYTDMLYGRVSFAILEDRKFKTGPKDVVQHDGPRPDHITDPSYRPADADVAEAVLLGAEQLAFLRHWAQDWEGTDLKATLSQTIFAGLATHHGGNQDRVLMDMDSNGWPQRGRNRALHEVRRGFALMIGGDQHLATIAHHGINEWDDAGFSFCVPSIANFYPRAWRPEGDPVQSLDDPLAPPFSGSWRDGFGNKVTVYAHTNPGAASGVEPASLHDRMPGYGIVRFRKSARTMTLECWPRHADPSRDEQYPGWPFEVAQMDNYGRTPVAWLPRLRFSGMRNPVVQVVDDFNNEILYTLRIEEQGMRLPVWEEGAYTLRIGELGTEREKVLHGINASTADDQELVVDI